jgi:hydroxymethylglutaryl-CoA lyase
MRGYISTVLWCPFEGRVAPDSVVPIAEKLLDLGCQEISLGDTIGKGTPGEVEALIAAVGRVIPREKLAVHFHDTYGQGLANVLAALQNGIAVVDSSVAGLGGCPFAPGATGNAASEDVLYMLNGLGIETGVDLISLIEAGKFISDKLGKKPASKVNLAMGKYERERL